MGSDSSLDSNLLCEKKGDLWLDQDELIYPSSITLSPEPIQGIRSIRVECAPVPHCKSEEQRSLRR